MNKNTLIILDISLNDMDYSDYCNGIMNLPKGYCAIMIH